MSNRDFLDALTDYQNAKENEHMKRANPPMATVDEYADRALAELNKIIDARCKEHAQRRLSLGAV
jgi:hypothetical protein